MDYRNDMYIEDLIDTAETATNNILKRLMHLKFGAARFDVLEQDEIAATLSDLMDEVSDLSENANKIVKEFDNEY